MSASEPALSFRDLLAYTDYLAQRWLNYFKQNPAALDVDVGGRTQTLRDLVSHIFQVEQFFADMLLQEGAGATRRPSAIEGKPGLDELARMHQDALQKLERYI